MVKTNLSQIVQVRPFHDYANWWSMGTVFMNHMSQAIVSQWSTIANTRDLSRVEVHLSGYLSLVYGQSMRQGLLSSFVQKSFSTPLWSGEFDALSYAFYRSAFELIEVDLVDDHEALAKARRLFTKRVGSQFFAGLQDELELKLPSSLNDEDDFALLKGGLKATCRFLQEQGYLRDSCDFSFTLDVEHGDHTIKQDNTQFVSRLNGEGVAYAVYIMGYPVILPSAVYLYHTMGEAQHHSSRTIEELFSRAGCQASETEDFDPLDYPSEKVVELWQIRKKRK